MKKRLSFLVKNGVQASKSELISPNYGAWRDFLLLIEKFGYNCEVSIFDMSISAVAGSSDLPPCDAVADRY